MFFNTSEWIIGIVNIIIARAERLYNIDVEYSFWIILRSKRKASIAAGLKACSPFRT